MRARRKQTGSNVRPVPLEAFETCWRHCSRVVLAAVPVLSSGWLRAIGRPCMFHRLVQQAQCMVQQAQREVGGLSRVSMWAGGGVEGQIAHLGDEAGSQFVELGVGVLAVAGQQVEGGVGVDPVDHHHDPFGLLDDGPMPEGFGDGVVGPG